MALGKAVNRMSCVNQRLEGAAASAASCILLNKGQISFAKRVKKGYKRNSDQVGCFFLQVLMVHSLLAGLKVAFLFVGTRKQALVVP